MLKNKEFGAAIGKAIERKLANGSVGSKAEIARHFGMQPPSLVDWVKKSSVAKDKLPELWRFFSDVAGPEHWGMSKDEWPAGLVSSDSLEQNQPSNHANAMPSRCEASSKHQPQNTEALFDEARELLLSCISTLDISRNWLMLTDDPYPAEAVKKTMEAIAASSIYPLLHKKSGAITTLPKKIIKSQRQKDIEQIMNLLNITRDDGIAIILGESMRIANERPRQRKQTK